MSYLGNSPGVSSQRNTTTITATAGQTTFTTTSGYQLGYIDVFLNGTKLVNGDDFTASNGTSITLTVAADVGDAVELVSYTPRGLSDGYTKLEADAKYLIDNVSSINNLLDVDTATTSPTNGQTLIWSTASSRWLPGTIAGGVTSITGTADQIAASTSTGAITLSLPQSINITSSPSFANITLTGELRGPSTLIIDPAAVGDDTGTVRVRGNLQVDGTTTTVNSTTLEVADLNITLAKNAINAGAADGAGITVAGASANLIYAAGTDAWSFNKNLGIGVTPPTVSQGKLLNIAYSGSGISVTSGTSLDLTNNAYYNSGWKYGQNGKTARIQLSDDQIYFGNATTGTAGNALTFTTVLAINASGHTLPGTDNSYDLGSFTARWRNIYTADMHFSNQGSQNSVDGTWGNWTLQEGEESIYMLNNRTGRKYKIVLEEV